MKVCLKVSIPSYRQVLGNDQLGAGHYVYEMEVVSNRFTVDQGAIGKDMETLSVGQAKVFRLEKRYSQFLALHSDLRKSYITPEFPPKRLINTSPGLLEQRRRALEIYMRRACTLTPTPSALISFLELSNYPNRNQPLPIDAGSKKPQRITHQPVIQFRQSNPFLESKTCCQSHCQACNGEHVLPDLVTQATLRLFYPDHKP